MKTDADVLAQIRAMAISAFAGSGDPRRADPGPECSTEYLVAVLVVEVKQLRSEVERLEGTDMSRRVTVLEDRVAALESRPVVQPVWYPFPATTPVPTYPPTQPPVPWCGTSECPGTSQAASIPSAIFGGGNTPPGAHA